MRWFEISIHTREEVGELIATGFHEMGAAGVTIEESGSLEKERDTSFGQWYEYPLNDLPLGEAIVQAYFADPESVDQLVAQLEEHVRFVRDELEYDVGHAAISTREVDEEDWAHSWKQYYKPLRISERLTIKPTWESYEPGSADELIIELDPGMAFGTGTHPTTALCLQAMEQEMSPGIDVIDVGTGSGVLAIAAGLLGARRVLALDLDPIAVSSAAGNIALNGLTSRINVMESDLLGVLRQADTNATATAKPSAAVAVLSEAQSDAPLQLGVRLPVQLVVANILAEIIMLFVQDVYDVLAPDGVYIASGIYKDKEQAVIESLQQAGFDISSVRRDQDWVAIAARKKREGTDGRTG